MKRCSDCGIGICKNSAGKCRKCSKTKSSYTYRGIHQWIKKIYGKADICIKESSLCKGRFEWANISGKYLKNINDWKQLCTRHHQIEHYAEIFGNKCPRGHEFTAENTYINVKGGGYRQCKACKINRQRDYRKRKNEHSVIGHRSINTTTQPKQTL